MDIGALVGGGIASVAVTALIMIFLFVFALSCPPGQDCLVISLCILWGLIMTYHRLYDYFIMIAVFGYFAARRIRYADILCLLTVCTVFFIPRLFDESRPSIMITGIIYYAFTVFMSVIAVRTVRSAGTGENDG